MKKRQEGYGSFHQYIINTVFGLRQRQNKKPVIRAFNEYKQRMGYQRKKQIMFTKVESRQSGLFLVN